jgi:hypothetical protein
MAKHGRARVPEDPAGPQLLLLRESGNALEAASPPFDAAATAARLREAATARGLLPGDRPKGKLAATGTQLEDDAPPFDVEAGATRLLNAARGRGLLPSKDPGDLAGQARYRRLVPDLDALLPEAACEALLDGRPYEQAAGPRLPMELQQLGETLAALRAAPSPSELRGEAAALSAFHETRDFVASTAGTLPPITPHDLVGHRWQQGRRRARGGARARRPRGRPSSARRSGLPAAAAAAAALVVILSVFAYLGPFHNAVRVANGTPSAKPPRPGASASGPGGLAGSSPIPASPIPASATATPGSSATTVSISAAARSSPAEPAVLAFVESYFTAINQHDYQAYVSLLAPRLAASVTASAFSSGLGSMADSAVMLTGISDLSGGKEAVTVSFTSHQNPAQSANGQDSCDHWWITLYLSPSGSSYLQVPPPADYTSRYQAC